MKDQELSRFIQQILITSSQEKAFLTLSELERMLQQLMTPPSQLRMIQIARDNYPETREMAIERNNASLTLADLQIAAERRRQRIAREKAMQNDGRC